MTSPAAAEGAPSRSTTTLRVAGAAILLCGLAGASFILLHPSGWTINRLNVEIWSWLRGHSLLPSGTTPEHMSAVWNIALFVPLGLGLALLHPRWWWAAALVCASAIVEAVQLLVLEQRTPELLDILLNGTGGAIGAGLGIFLARTFEKRVSHSIDSQHG